MCLREIMTIRGGSRTFVIHLRSLVENVTHFLNHYPFPKTFLKLQCQEMLVFSRQLIHSSAHGLWSCFPLFWSLAYSESNGPASLQFFKALRHSCSRFFDSLLLVKPHWILVSFIYLTKKITSEQLLFIELLLHARHNWEDFICIMYL